MVIIITTLLQEFGPGAAYQFAFAPHPVQSVW
jgi:hypothetical protein